jgi:hypothetical protein
MTVSVLNNAASMAGAGFEALLARPLLMKTAKIPRSAEKRAAARSDLAFAPLLRMSTAVPPDAAPNTAAARHETAAAFRRSTNIAAEQLFVPRKGAVPYNVRAV